MSPMATLAAMTSSGEVALLDRSVVEAIATSLDGHWTPQDETDPEQRERRLAAARLRLYGDRDRSGWFLLTTAQARAGLDESETGAWTVGFVPALESFDDAPASDEVAGQASLFDDLDGDAACTLAVALLVHGVTLVVTTDVRRYKHARPHDLPDRLEVVDVVVAAHRLTIEVGETPYVDIPDAVALDLADPWWVVR